MTPDPRPFALIREADTTTALLGEGLAMLVREGWRSGAGAPAWTCLASGAERLMKLTIGLTAEAVGKPWPSAEIRNIYGHRLSALRPEVDRALGERITDAAAPPYIRALVGHVNDDPYLPLIFEALAQWSESTGRYRDFNILGGEKVEGYAPSAAWESAEQRVLVDRPEWLGRLAGPDNRAALVDMRSELARTVVRWWFLHYRAWAHGVFGAVASQHSSSLDPRSSPVIGAFAEETLAGL